MNLDSISILGFVIGSFHPSRGFLWWISSLTQGSMENGRPVYAVDLAPDNPIVRTPAHEDYQCPISKERLKSLKFLLSFQSANEPLSRRVLGACLRLKGLLHHRHKRIVKIFLFQAERMDEVLVFSQCFPEEMPILLLERNAPEKVGQRKGKQFP
jgi:hypothetical protein